MFWFGGKLALELHRVKNRDSRHTVVEGQFGWDPNLKGKRAARWKATPK